MKKKSFFMPLIICLIFIFISGCNNSTSFEVDSLKGFRNELLHRYSNINEINMSYDRVGINFIAYTDSDVNEEEALIIFKLCRQYLIQNYAEIIQYFKGTDKEFCESLTISIDNNTDNTSKGSWQFSSSYFKRLSDDIIDAFKTWDYFIIGEYDSKTIVFEEGLDENLYNRKNKLKSN